ncbi:MAG TPA: peptidylprolyl isomerase [Polyangiaceae bacterium]|nr:peptidylprolyl isomerase [Polyangiaceae bacterium]
MLKLRLVALATLAAIVGLVFSLSALNRHRKHEAAPAASQQEPGLAAPLASVSIEQPAASAEAPTAMMPPVSADGFRDYGVLPDGRPVPALPPTAPKSCGFGAILFTYDGVQLAPRNARTKAEALALATRLIADAERDFADAVKKGDPGSLADAGNVGRGVLERSIEYQLFTLEKGKVYPEPIETPRGYWILRRLR